MIKKFQKFEWFIDIKTMVEGETFGELALVKNDPRAATIKCDSDCYFGVIDKIDYDKFLKKVHNKTIQKDIDFLASLPFFNHWTVTQMRKIVLSFNVEIYQRNQVVYKQGDTASVIYIA